MKLNEEQRQLVEENTGLINVHIRKFVSLPRSPHRQREYDDLFQEGCLALMQASQTYSEDRHGPFAAYAIPRIHHAVSIALYERFATVRVPAKSIKRARERQRNRHESDRHRPEPALVDTHNMADGSYDGPVACANRHRPSATGGSAGRPWRGKSPTLRDRLREKYEAAVREGAARIAASGRGRQDRGALIQRFVEDRLLIPEPSSQTSKRQLARDFECSIGRVQSCEETLVAEIRNLLSEDDEFKAVLGFSRSEEDGMDAIIDDAVVRELDHVARDGFAVRFAALPAESQATVLRELVRRSIGSLSRFAARLFRQLDMAGRAHVLGIVMDAARALRKSTEDRRTRPTRKAS